MSHFFPIDYMHCVLIGVSGKLLDLWFGKENKGKAFNFHDQIDQVSELIKSVRPPSFISKAPLELAKLKYWKGTFCSALS